MDDDLLRLYEDGIKTLGDIKEDYAARLAARKYRPEEVLLKTGLLCLKLTEQYFGEQKSNSRVDQPIEAEMRL